MADDECANKRCDKPGYSFMDGRSWYELAKARNQVQGHEPIIGVGLQSLDKYA
jgi:hypothetical protein